MCALSEGVSAETIATPRIRQWAFAEVKAEVDTTGLDTFVLFASMHFSNQYPKVVSKWAYDESTIRDVQAS